LGESVSAGHWRSAREPIAGIAAVNRELDSYERTVLRLVPEELRERVRRHLYEARARAAAAAGECTAYGGHVRGGVSSDMSHIRVPI